MRYEPVLRLVRELGGGRLADVGSGSLGVAPWLGPAWTVTRVDRSFDDYGGASGPGDATAGSVVADARDLPFPDRVFDVVLALDVLEHVAPADRAAVVRELARVTRRRLIVACPTGEAALAADRRLAAFYDRRGIGSPGWLDEHLDNGFPGRDELSGLLAPLGRVRLFDNEHVASHGALMRLEALTPTRRLGAALSLALARGLRDDSRLRVLSRAVLWLIRGGDRRPSYRTLAVADRAAD